MILPNKLTYKHKADANDFNSVLIHHTNLVL